MVSAIWLSAIGTFSGLDGEADLAGTAGRSRSACRGAAREFGTDEKETVVTPQARAIIRDVAALCAVTPANILTRCRTRAAVHARIEIARRLRGRRYSTSQIGRILNRDHTTIVYYLGGAKRTVAPLLWRKPKIRHLNCACCPWPKEPKPKKPASKYLVPYAGAYPPEYNWKERESIRCTAEQQPEFST